MNKQNFKNAKSMYPVSVDTLNFMQDQTLLLGELACMIGENVIIREPSGSIDGLCIFDGELMPLKSGAGNCILPIETTETVIAKGETYSDARVVRYAQYVNSGLAASSFVRLASVEKIHSSLSRQMSEQAQHDVPKGTVIDWYGACDCDHVPYGWVPCGMFFTSSASQFAVGGAGVLEKEKWEALYDGEIEITSKALVPTGGSSVGILISECNGQVVPDLTDRFVVHAGGSYKLGAIGGKKEVTLTAAESGLPSHSHKASTSPELGKYKASASIEHSYNETTGEAGTGLAINVSANEAQDASSAHENRPPYYALYKLIKVI